MIVVAIALALAAGQGEPPASRSVVLDGDVNLTLHWIPPGVLRSGSALTPEVLVERYGGSAELARGEHPPREVMIERGFYLGRTEVTVGQFEAFVRSTGYRTTAEQQGFGFRLAEQSGWERVPGLCWSEPGWELDAEQAVAYVTHDDALAFCRWLSDSVPGTFRLPRGTEWEHACGGGGAPFAVGDSVQELKRVAWFGRGRSQPGPSRVAQLEAGPNGLFDMHGNVWEWCLDRRDSGPDRPQLALLKGGSFLNGPFMLRVAYRPFDEGSLAEPHLGFRVLAEGFEAPTQVQGEPERHGDLGPPVAPRAENSRFPAAVRGGRGSHAGDDRKAHIPRADLERRADPGPRERPRTAGALVPALPRLPGGSRGGPGPGDLPAAAA